jgi:hypothetical protein
LNWEIQKKKKRKEGKEKENGQHKSLPQLIVLVDKMLVEMNNLAERNAL